MKLYSIAVMAYGGWASNPSNLLGIWALGDLVELKRNQTHLMLFKNGRATAGHATSNVRLGTHQS